MIVLVLYVYFDADLDQDADSSLKMIKITDLLDCPSLAVVCTFLLFLNINICIVHSFRHFFAYPVQFHRCAGVFPSMDWVSCKKL